MEKFVYEYATKVYFGDGAAKEHLAEAISGYGQNVMLAYGGGSVKKNGIYDEVKGSLESAGKKVTDFSGVMSNPTYKKVQEGAKLAKEEKIDFILAVGGGSVIDCCKIIAAQAKTERDLWEMEMTGHQFPTEVLPMGAIVTASGTGAEMNGGAVITNEEKVIKSGMAAAAPRFAILDPGYTASVPRMQVISGAFDTLSHAMETYFGRSDENNLSDDVALAIMRNTVVNMRRLLKNIDDMQARGNGEPDVGFRHGGKWYPEGGQSDGFPGSSAGAPAGRLHGLQPWTRFGGDPSRLLPPYRKGRGREIPEIRKGGIRSGHGRGGC